MKKILLIALFMFLSGVYTAPSFASADTPKAAVELYNAGIDFYNAGNTEKSVESFKKAIAIDPKFYEAHYNLVQIQSATGKLDDAITTYTALLQIKPDDQECIFELGHMLYKRGYLKKALTYLDRVPPESEYYSQAEELIDKIIARQRELEAIKTKETEALKAKQIEALKAKETEALKAKELADKKIQEFGTKSTIYSGIANPSGVAADKEGNVYIASYSENTIYKINKANQKSVFVAPAVLDGPIGLAIDDNDNLYVANYNKGNILKVTPVGAPTIFLTVKKPYCLSVSMQTLYITEQDGNTTIKFPL